MFSIIGAVVEKVADAVLPEKYEAVGDILGIIVDANSGNYLGAAEHAVDLAKDGNLGNLFGEGEPGPPPTGRGDPFHTTATGGRGPYAVAPMPGDFFSLSDKDFMAAIRDGRIPKEVLDDKGAMLRLQERMGRISEMNNLMSLIVQAMHQMNMGIINNCRV